MGGGFLGYIAIFVIVCAGVILLGQMIFGEEVMDAISHLLVSLAFIFGLVLVGLYFLNNGLALPSGVPQFGTSSQQPGESQATATGQGGGRTQTAPTAIPRPTDPPVEMTNDQYHSIEVSQSFPDEEPCKSGAPDKITFKVANSGQQPWAGLKAKLFYGSNADTEVLVPDAQPGATVSVVVNFTCATFAEGGPNDHMLRYLVMTPSGEPMPGGFDWSYTSVP
jgi:hypothetical protein